MNRIILDVCCGPCSTHCINELKKHYQDITLFFSNFNIYPKEEYEKRLENAGKAAAHFGLKLESIGYNPEEWNNFIKGLEAEPENGKRCEKCFEFRFRKLIDHHPSENFTTTLTISPYKNAEKIKQIGERIAKEAGEKVSKEIGKSISKGKFIFFDFKENDGYKKSIELSKQLGLYRQKYCGCIFSMSKNQH
jgi:predicted adenine nucleotide alpha hydrolase (AANH) superfamily ATPase